MTQQKQNCHPTLQNITQAKLTLNPIVVSTPLLRNTNLSERYSSNVFLKREDLQIVRSYKIRGAYNKISGLSEEERLRGVVCAGYGKPCSGSGLFVSVAWHKRQNLHAHHYTQTENYSGKNVRQRQNWGCSGGRYLRCCFGCRPY